MSTTLPQTAQTNLLPDASQLQAMLQFADTLLKSGLLPSHIRTPQAAFAVIQKGRELAIPPLYALSNIVVISGKPTANAELMQALIYRDHGDDALRFVETSDQIATIAYKRRSWPAAERFSFSIEDAKRANLIKNGPWTQYPAAMLRARAISAVARLAFADSIGGLYTSEELGATVRVESDGELVVEALPEPVALPQRGELRTVDTSTGEIHEPPPAAATPRQNGGKPNENAPAPQNWLDGLAGLHRDALLYDATIELPPAHPTLAEARVLKKFYEDVIAEGKLQAQGVPL